jgi:hypothetical protein
MKKLTLFLLFFSLIGISQNTKPDFANLPTLNFIRLTIKGADLQNQIWQDSLVKIKELKLTGTDAENFTIIYYHFKTNYKKSLTVDEFFDGQIPDIMNTFFKDLEKNCKISFEDIVIKNKENGKMFKISPLALLIKT